MTESDYSRFLEKVHFEPMSGCWLWNGSYATSGYGAFAINGKNYRAHRVSYQHHQGDFSADLVVCHSCDNKACVNPDHLWLGTHLDNVMDRVRKNRSARQRGALSGNAKLTQEQADYIRQSTERGCDLAEKFNISRTNISRIRLNKAWM